MGVSKRLVSSHLLLLVGCLVRAASASCYLPNGTVDTGQEYAPCKNTGETSMCCALNRGNNSELCLANGLCRSAHDSPTYWRDQCSDADWANNKYCLDVCLDSVDKNGNAQMTPCDGTSESETWCCGPTKDCCAGEHAITLAPNLGSRVSTDTLTNHPSSKEGSQLSDGTKAGIGIGVSVGVIVLMTFLFFVRRAERKRVGTSLHQHYDYRPTGTTQETVGIPVNDLPPSSVTAKHESPA